MESFDIRAQRARRVDLGEFLIKHHPDQIKVTGNSVYLLKYDSVYTKPGYCGYTRFSTGETGNAVDLLVRYLGYRIEDAVDILARDGTPVVTDYTLHRNDTELKLPVAAELPYSRVYAYLLKQRGIPAPMIRLLFREGLLYQEAGTGNAVFISRDRKFCELRGTNTYAAQPFHGIRRARPDAFWSLRLTRQKVEEAFLCEGAIDAISLAVLHQQSGYDKPAAYVSIGGVCNQQTINRIKGKIHTILAMDNDVAGRACCDRNASLERLLPEAKDWNEELLKRSQKPSASASE